MRLQGPEKVQSFPDKYAKTMICLKVSWGKSPKLKKGDVICTRLILSAAIGAVKKHEFQRGSVRTICLCKWPNRTVMGGAGPVLLPVPIHAPPVQADNSYLLTKINDDCWSNTLPGSHQSRHTIPTKKRMLPITGGILLINYLDLYLSISNRILNSCSCSSGVLAERNS